MMASTTDNVQFIAAVNRGREFSATFGIDAAQLDRFAPLQVTYPPPPEEEKILRTRHPSLGQETIALLVKIADVIRNAPEMNGTLSLRATDEACIYLAHDHFKDTPRISMPEILKSSFCARFSGKWSDATSDAGLVWMTIVRVMREAGVTIEG